MPDVMWIEMREQATSWIYEISTYIKKSFQGTLTVETKSNDSDLVTNIDKEVEQFFVNRIRKTYVGHVILGEEGFGDELSAGDGVVWVIDPIDGTTNFIHQQRNFAISIGVYHNGIGMLGIVYDVFSGELYHAIRDEGAYVNDSKLSKLERGELKNGILSINATWLTKNKQLDHEKMGKLVNQARGSRAYGCASLEMVYVATGKLDAYITPRLAPWDYAAGCVIAREVGAIATTLQGDELSLLRKSGLLIARPGVYEEIMKSFEKNN